MKMGTCYWCEEYSDELESWGTQQLCQKCVKDYVGDFPTQPPSNMSDVSFEKPKNSGYACYNPHTGTTELTNPKVGRIAETLNHEFMHFILHRDFGIRCCYQYDSIYDVVDKYHDSSI